MAAVTTDLSVSISELYADAASLHPGDKEAERLDKVQLNEVLRDHGVAT